MAKKNPRNAFAFLLIGLASSLAVGADLAKPAFPIKNTGKEFPINFSAYGSFSGVGSDFYKFKITDRVGLAKAMGAGMYPDAGLLSDDPTYRAWKNKHPQPGNHWSHVDTGDPKSDFYVWATARDIGPGTKLLFTGHALEAAGHYKQALKAYYGVLVLFPREACWSADHSFVWYVADDALNRILFLTHHHAEIGYKLDGAIFKVKNAYDTDLKNDEFVINPGRWVKNNLAAPPTNLAQLKIIQQRGYGAVHAVQYENKQWQLIVDGKPFFVHGVNYTPTPIGQHIADVANQWMRDDSDENGRPDAPYDTWVDANKNNHQDTDEKAVGDFALMRGMGANAIRLYRSSQGLEYDPGEFNKEVLRDLTATYGVRVIMGDFVGAYTIGSGATWDAGTDYTNPVQLQNMRGLIKSYVNDHKKEPYVLMWLLGNENLMPSDYSGVNATRTQAARQVEAYLKFIDEIAEMIHQIDPDHPVAVGNLDLLYLDDYAKFAPHVDIFGANSYRGNKGFGNLWRSVQQSFDRPVLITEYGCDAYDSRAQKENEKDQALYHEAAWQDIDSQRAGGLWEGNAIGGVIFEYVDEWWKSHNGSKSTHEATKDSPMAFPDGWASEEWYGMVSQGNGNGAPFMRQLRQVYALYRDKLWKN